MPAPDRRSRMRKWYRALDLAFHHSDRVHMLNGASPIMAPLLAFHALAAPRGDGLRPELLALFQHLAAASEPHFTATESCRQRADGAVQSGPHRVSAEVVALPEGVLRYPAHS